MSSGSSCSARVVESGMSSQEIAELRKAAAELQHGLRSIADATHATLHLLAYLYTTRCLSAPDPIAEYKHMATALLGSLGAIGTGELPSYEDETRNAIAHGLRHHVGEFLLTLQAHVEANVKSDDRFPPKTA